MGVEPVRPLPTGWVPSPDTRRALKEEFGHVVDLNLSLRRFRNHYSEGQTSRNWEARFENWVLSDASRVAERSGTDDLGVPATQGNKSIVPPPLRPGDEGYFNPLDV